MFKLVFESQPAKQLAKMNEPYYSLIVQELSSLKENYFPGGKNCKRLTTKTRDVYRIRIGPYRAMYHVSHPQKIITVLRIFNRSEGY